MLFRSGQRIHRVIHLQVPESQLVTRLTERSRLEGRADDNHDGIAKRLEIYRERTQPVLNYYLDLGLVENIDGSGDPQAVHQEIVSHLKIDGPV